MIDVERSSSFSQMVVLLFHFGRPHNVWFMMQFDPFIASSNEIIKKKYDLIGY